MGEEIKIDQATEDPRITEAHSYAEKMMRNEPYDPYTNIQIGEKYESVGLLDEARKFYEKAKINAYNSMSAGMGAWLVANSLDGQISEERRTEESERRKEEYERIIKLVDEKLGRLKTSA